MFTYQIINSSPFKLYMVMEKAALFALPLIFMKIRCPNERVVSFVFVPLISAMTNMVKRLSKHCLKCCMVKYILGWNDDSDRGSLTADIYVCSCENIDFDCLKTTINNCYYHFKLTYS